MIFRLGHRFPADILSLKKVTYFWCEWKGKSKTGSSTKHKAYLNLQKYKFCKNVKRNRILHKFVLEINTWNIDYRGDIVYRRLFWEENWCSWLLSEHSCLAKPLHDRLKTNPIPWSDTHTNLVHQIKKQIQTISLLHLTNPLAPKNELNVLTSEKQFVLNKTHFKNDFYGNHNSEKRSWFFEHFLQQRHIMQKQFYDFVELNRIQILFFDWFELYYASAHHVTYPFASIKHACPITTRSKTPVWNLTSGPPVESDHPPPIRNIQLNHKDQTVDAAPYKIPGDDTLTNTKHIIQQNNFTNTNLNT